MAWCASASAASAKPPLHSTNDDVQSCLLSGSTTTASAPSASASQPRPATGDAAGPRRNQSPARTPSSVVAIAGSVLSSPSGSCARPLPASNS